MEWLFVGFMELLIFLLLSLAIQSGMKYQTHFFWNLARFMLIGQA
jgi:hypothetical protein